MDNEYFGWELLFALVRNDIRDDNDLLAAVVHFLLLKNGFLCLGNGDEKAIKDSDTPSELLPAGWNAKANQYSMRYINKGLLYVLDGVVIPETVEQLQSDNPVPTVEVAVNKTAYFTMLNVTDGLVKNVSFDMKDILPSYGQPNTSPPPALATSLQLNQLVPKVDLISYRVRDELVAKTKAKVKMDPGTSGGPSGSDPKRLRTSGNASSGIELNPSSKGPPRTMPQYRDPMYGSDPLRDPFGNIGRRDLDPFANGGMLGTLPDPLARQRYPPLPGHIPGARFDPMGPMPMPPGKQYRPDNDHLPAPGFEDNMYS